MAAAKRATSMSGPKAKRPAKAAAAKKPAARRRAKAEEAPPPSTFRPFEALKNLPLVKPAAAKKVKPEPRTPRSESPITFASAMRGVRPLDPAEIRIAPPSEEDESAAATLRSLVMSGVTFEVVDDGATLQGRRIDVDPRELRRLRQEHYAVDGTLDLHKHSVAEARLAVVAFVARRAREGDKVIAIVHGKGKHSVGGECVLRGELGAWLSQGDAARHVHAFASVVDRLGESGRLLVKLG